MQQNNWGYQKCTLGVFIALAFMADFSPDAPEFYQRTHRVRLKTSGTSDKKSSHKIKYKKIPRVHQNLKGGFYMKITFIGATHEVTGSCYYLEAAGHKFLVDCGMEQGPDYYENAEIPVALGEIEFVLLTHAHIDHSGNLPAIYAKGFRGPVYATDATSHL